MATSSPYWPKDGIERSALINAFAGMPALVVLVAFFLMGIKKKSLARYASHWLGPVTYFETSTCTASEYDLFFGLQYGNSLCIEAFDDQPDTQCKLEQSDRKCGQPRS
jgi:hypothetical protein